MSAGAGELTSAQRAPVKIPMRIGNHWRDGVQWDDVIDPFRRTLVAQAPRSSSSDLDDAISSATETKRAAREWPAYERAACLLRAADLLVERSEDLAATLSREAGKALKDSRAEVVRTIETIRFSAEEAIRITGEHVPLDGSALGAGKIAMLLRFPVGLVAAITPFNAPINLTAHKIAPAIAAGNTVVLKPPPQAALSVHRLVETFIASGLSPGVLNVVYGPEAGPRLVRDPRVDFISFTGSGRVGAEIKAASGLKRVALELGGVGTTIVHSDAEVVSAATQCVRNGVRLAGQSCVSVQTVYVHSDIADHFIEAAVREVQQFKFGDPLDPEVDVGPLIDEPAARRVESWVAEAVAAGAKVLAGGRRHGTIYEPTILTDVRPEMKVVCQEIFGPVICILPYDDVDTVIDEVSASPFGLQCGLFTQSMPLAIKAVRQLRTGAVIVNGTSTWRPDQLPYGGIKQSGIGREGPRYAIRDMTDEKLIVFNL